MNPQTELLRQLIAIPSLSREEKGTADLLESYLKGHGLQVHRKKNNVWVTSSPWHAEWPTVLLNSHHDTVRPNVQYTRDPFQPTVEAGKLFGLGSNDAGGALVCLLHTFLHFEGTGKLKCNLVFAASAEEEISGLDGIELIWHDLPAIDCAIVGEPTLCQLAIAEKGLLVVDALATGVAGHAAREEGVNALYKAVEDIQWVRSYQFPKVSPVLGPVKMSVTIIEAGKQHNMVPAECRYTLDIRVTEQYTHEEILAVLRSHLQAELTPRSLRLRASGIDAAHPLVQAAHSLAIPTYGSPTTSDQALMPVPSVKIGPGDSARSHSADEFIYLEELEAGLTTYIQLLTTAFGQQEL